MVTQEREYFILRGTVQRQKLDEDVERIVHALQRQRLHPGARRVVRHADRPGERRGSPSGSWWWRGRSSRSGASTSPATRSCPSRRSGGASCSSRATCSRGRKLRDSVKAITDLYSAIGRASADVDPDRSRRTCRTGRSTSPSRSSRDPRSSSSGSTSPATPGARRRSSAARSRWPRAISSRARSSPGRSSGSINLNYFEKVKAKTAPGPVQGQDRRQHRRDGEAHRPLLRSAAATAPRTASSAPSTSPSATSSAGAGRCSSASAAAPRRSRARSASRSRGSSIGRWPPASTSSTTGGSYRLHGRTRSAVTSASAIPSGSTRAWNAVYRVSQDKVSDVDSQRQPEPPRPGGHPPSRRWSACRLTRDTRDSVFEPTRGGNSCDRRRLRRASGFGEQWSPRRGLDVTVLLQPTPWFDHVLSGRALDGATARLGQEPGPALRALLPGRRQLHPELQGPGGLAEGLERHRIGGNIQVLGNIEYTVPLFFGIRVAVFFDVGNVWGPDISAATNASTSTTSSTAVGPGLPMDVALRTASGWTTASTRTRKPVRRFGNFNFSVGSAF